jgi:hypothetical protein
MYFSPRRWHPLFLNATYKEALLIGLNYRGLPTELNTHNVLGPKKRKGLNVSLLGHVSCSSDIIFLIYLYMVLMLYQV